MDEPERKRAVSFVDGQNLFQHAKSAFGYYHPNYDPIKLARAVCAHNGWQQHGVHFYTGVPQPRHDNRWHQYWTRRLTALKRANVEVYSRPLAYNYQLVEHPDGTRSRLAASREKGIDIRICLDIVRMARKHQFDVAVVFSQDQDLSEVAREIRAIAASSGNWLKIVSAFPTSPTASSSRGINNTDWFPMNKRFYDACLDPRDYRPPNWK